MAEYPFPPELVERVIQRRGRLHCFDDFEPRRTALLVVDMQTGFLKPEWPTSLASAREIVPTINRLARALREAGGQVVWLISTYGPDPADRWPLLFDQLMGAEAGGFFRRVLSEGHEGHGIWPALERLPGEPVVAKNRFGGFSGSGGRLEAVLRARGIDTLLVVGTVTNVCCESTAREAAFANFRTVMVSDANAGRSEQDNLVTFSTFIRAFGDVLSSEAVLARLEALARGARAAARG